MTSSPDQPRPRLYSGQSSDERDAERRRRLLEAAKELIGTAGYAALSVERLCSAAKVSTRHFYKLYDGKEAAFLDLYEEITAQSFLRATAALAATEGEPITTRIPRAFLAYIGPMVEDIRNARIAFVEIVGASPRVEERRLKYRESLVEVIMHEGRLAADRGEIADRDFRTAALALAGAANAVAYDWTLREDREDVATLEGELARLALLLLAG